jgi:hypothetical protein
VKFRPFAEAREFVHRQGIKNQSERYEYCKSGKKPEDIPMAANDVYRKEWKGFGDWLGTGTIASRNRKFRSFAEARKFVHTLGLKNISQWENYHKSGEKPEDIPQKPYGTYKNQWKGFGDWLGTGTIATQSRTYRPFEEARKFVHMLELKNQREWKDYCKSGKKPSDVPDSPDRSYRNEWKSWGDWFGTIAPSEIEYRAFEEARKFVHSLRLKDRDEWYDYCKSGKKPEDIPSNPDKTYGMEFGGYSDWIGYEGTWTKLKVKDLLRDLIKSKIIYQWDEAVLYSFFIRKGLLNLYI